MSGVAAEGVEGHRSGGQRHDPEHGRSHEPPIETALALDRSVVRGEVPGSVVAAVLPAPLVVLPPSHSHAERGYSHLDRGAERPLNRELPVWIEPGRAVAEAVGDRIPNRWRLSNDSNFGGYN